MNDLCLEVGRDVCFWNEENRMRFWKIMEDLQCGWSDSLTDLEETFMDQDQKSFQNYENLQGGRSKGVRTKQRF